MEPKGSKAKAKAKAKPKAGPVSLPIAVGKGPKAAPGSKSAVKVFRLKITLKDIKPPVWRRVLVPDCTLFELHEIIQTAMGWDGYHLHEFEIDGRRFTDPESADQLEAEDEDKFTLGRLIAKEKVKFRYNYDFGDDWRHEILVEKILPPGEGVAFAVCVDGKRACPPEDTGGPWGYAEFLEVIGDPSHEEHAERLEWAGGEFDPESFDIEEVNASLRALH